MTDVVLTWRAALDADASTEYDIESDAAQSGVFANITTRSATDRGDGAYSPYTTTLVGNTARAVTLLTFADATNFAEGDYVLVDREIIKLGAKTDDSFAGCLRGQLSTLSADHAGGATVAQCHETYTVTGVNFGTRHVIRYRITRVQGAAQAVGHLLVAVLPSLPPESSLVTVYGILQTTEGEAKAEADVTLAISGPSNVDPSTTEVYTPDEQATTTDADGYFEVLVPKSAFMSGTETLTLTAGDLTWELTNVPDVSYINFLEL
jgi:hypothetical protein